MLIFQSSRKYIPVCDNWFFWTRVQESRISFKEVSTKNQNSDAGMSVVQDNPDESNVPLRGFESRDGALRASKTGVAC